MQGPRQQLADAPKRTCCSASFSPSMSAAGSQVACKGARALPTEFQAATRMSGRQVGSPDGPALHRPVKQHVLLAAPPQAASMRRSTAASTPRASPCLVVVQPPPLDQHCGLAGLLVAAARYDALHLPGVQESMGAGARIPRQMGELLNTTVGCHDALHHQGGSARASLQSKARC